MVSTRFWLSLQDMINPVGDSTYTLDPSTPIYPPQTGTPLPLGRQGGGGLRQLAQKGSPLPIPFLGDELNGVSDVKFHPENGRGVPLYLYQQYIIDH